MKEKHTGIKTAKEAKKKRGISCDKDTRTEVRNQSTRGENSDPNDSFRACMKLFDEAEVTLEQKRLQGDEWRQCFERQKETWGTHKEKYGTRLGEFHESVQGAWLDKGNPRHGQSLGGKKSKLSECKILCKRGPSQKERGKA